MFKYYVNLFQKYFKPTNIFEQNLLLLKLLKYFSAIPLNIEKEGIALDVKYLVYPSLLIIYNILTYFYLLKTYFLVNSTDCIFHLETTILFTVVNYGVFLLVYIFVAEYLRKESIIELMKKLNAFDNSYRILDKNFHSEMKYYHTPIFINLGFLLFVSTWCFFLDHSIWKLYVILIDSLFIIQHVSMILIIYFYISLVYSVSRRFFYLTKKLRLQNELLCINVCDEELENMSKALMKLFEILNILNNSFGVPVCISILLFFLWIILDYFTAIKLFTMNVQLTYSLLSIAFASVNQLFIFVLLWTCDHCTRQV